MNFFLILQTTLPICTVMTTGERQEAHILKFNSLPPHAQLVCQVNLFQLPYEDGCNHELWCTKCATWLCIILFQTLFIHISGASYCGYKMLSNIVNSTYPESCDSAYYENVKVVHLPAFKAAHLSVMLDMVSRNTDSGVGGNVGVFTEANFKFKTTKISTLN